MTWNIFECATGERVVKLFWPDGYGATVVMNPGETPEQARDRGAAEVERRRVKRALNASL